MKLAIIILAAVAAFAQTGGDHYADPKCLGIGTGKMVPCAPDPRTVGGQEVPDGATTNVPWVAISGVARNHISVDMDKPYSQFAVILRRNSTTPIAFCNIRMGRCWDLVGDNPKPSEVK